MIQFTTGDIFQSDAQALVNPVNCVGVMGAGLALKFKDRYPDNFRAYADACHRKRLAPGKLFTFEMPGDDAETRPYQNPGKPRFLPSGRIPVAECNPSRYIINFPTKVHWKDPSQLEHVEMGLRALAREITSLRIDSVAIPALGAGLGGLEWPGVKDLIKSTMNRHLSTRITVYQPGSRG